MKKTHFIQLNQLLLNSNKTTAAAVRHFVGCKYTKNAFVCDGWCAR